MGGLTIAALVTAKAYVWVDRAYEARGLRLHPQTFEALRRHVEVDQPLFPSAGLAPALTGLAVYVDRYLPPGVWRLTAENEALLYDSRQGQKGAEW